MYSRLAKDDLEVCSSCLYVPNAEITDTYPHASCIQCWGQAPRAECTLGEHSSNWSHPRLFRHILQADNLAVKTAAHLCSEKSDRQQLHNSLISTVTAVALRHGFLE